MHIRILLKFSLMIWRMPLFNLTAISFGDSPPLNLLFKFPSAHESVSLLYTSRSSLFPLFIPQLISLNSDNFS